MRFLSPLLAAAALAGGAAAQSTVTIDFEFFPGPDGVLGTGDDVPVVAPTLFSAQTLQLTDEYSPLGVDFTPNPAIDNKNEILDAATFNTPAGHTPPNLLASSGSETITGSFSVPVTSVSALIGISGGSDELVIYDAAGTILASQVGDDVVVTLNAPAGTTIASFEVLPFGSTTPAIDNLEFVAGPVGPVLSATGSPGGLMTFDFSNFTANGVIAGVYGTAGVLIVGNGPCAGLQVDLLPLAPPLFFNADGNGNATLNQNVGAGAAGLTAQAVDVVTCAASNSIVL